MEALKAFTLGGAELQGEELGLSSSQAACHFSCAGQLMTNVIGSESPCVAGIALIKNRLPSAVTSNGLAGGETA